MLTSAFLQDAVRGDFNELSKLLIDHGGKVWSDGQVALTAFGHQRLCLTYISVFGGADLAGFQSAFWLAACLFGSISVFWRLGSNTFSRLDRTGTRLGD